MPVFIDCPHCFRNAFDIEKDECGYCRSAIIDHSVLRRLLQTISVIKAQLDDAERQQTVVSPVELKSV
jgi:hypothetical protein